MSNIIRTAVAAGAFYAWSIGLSHEAFAEPAQDAQQETTTTTTTDTTIPQETTTTFSETTPTTTSPDCLEDDTPDMVKVPIEGTNKYQIVNGKTGTVCSLETVDSIQIYNGSTEVKQDTLARTGNHTTEEVALAVGLIISGAAMLRLEKESEARKAKTV